MEIGQRGITVDDCEVIQYAKKNVAKPYKPNLENIL